MNADQTASILYLVLLGSVIAGSLFLSSKETLTGGLRHAAIWALIFIGVVAAYGLWTDVEDALIPSQAVFAEEGRIEVPRDRDGHYRITLAVNDTPIEFIVDTGASDLVLSQDDARKVGLDLNSLSFRGEAATANGVVSTARVWLEEVEIGPIRDTEVPAVVSGGEMPGSLLGMSYLDRFNAVSFGNGRMILDR